jgi:hypothetical protein
LLIKWHTANNFWIGHILMKQQYIASDICLVEIPSAA